jgi:cytochrome c peroxidase
MGGHHFRALSAPALGALFTLTACGPVADANELTELPKLPVGLAGKGFEVKLAADNPLTVEKASLGKQLFFDKRLSSNGALACQSCHLPEKAWTDGVALAVKADGNKNTRNSPSLLNVGFLDLLYWDGRAATLEKNVEAAWKSQMGGDPAAAAKQLAAIPGYRAQFEKAFGPGDVTGDHIVKALASFLRTVYGGNSPWDRYEAGDRGAVSQDAIAGYAVFNKAGCVACHMPPLYTDRLFHNVGAGVESASPDVGRGKIVPDDPKMTGAFKTPSLRGASRSGPYFHDGSVATLDEAVKFMAAGGRDNPHRDILLKDAKLSEDELRQLVAFVRALDGAEPFNPPKLP